MMSFVWHQPIFLPLYGFVEGEPTPFIPYIRTGTHSWGKREGKNAIKML